MTVITDQMVETAARAIYGSWGYENIYDSLPEKLKDDVRSDARAALEAVAPLIAAQTLRHEADNAPGASDVPNGAWYLTRYSRNYLRVRADQLEREAGQ